MRFSLPNPVGVSAYSSSKILTMNIEILTPERLNHWCTRLTLPQPAETALQGVADVVRTDPQLLQIFTDFHLQTAIQGQWMREWRDLPFDPQVQAKLADRTSLFYFLAYLAALPYTWQRYHDLGISEHIFDDTMLDFRCYAEDYFDLHGVRGYAQFAWIWRHLSCELFRLGRMQYMLTSFDGGVTAFRQRETGQICLLADPNQPLRADGYAQGAGKVNKEDLTPDEPAWQPVFDAAADGWRGCRVNPRGFVERDRVFLPSAEWDLILQNGDTILDLHIPRKDPLNAETCGASYAQALEFFSRFFPDRPPKALFCHTWMFTPQLQELLPPESNLVKFQREFYLFPHAGDERFLWTFVFGDKHPSPATAPRDTSLRGAVLDWLAAGREIFDLPGLMFHRPEAWGTQPYQGYPPRNLSSAT
jgi:hypothetical protein